MSEPVIPSAVLDKCFIPYSPDSPPALYGVPVVLANQDTNPSYAIGLAPNLLLTAVAAISDAFTSGSGSPLVDSNDLVQDKLPVTVICSPHRNSLVAVDAAVRHFAHNVQADVVILDPADLAAGRRGVFGEELTDAFWQLYNHHYSNSESNPSPISLRRRQSSPSLESDSQVHDPDSRTPGLETPSNETDKIEDPSFAQAKALVHKFFLMCSSANSGGGGDNSSNRRRILYFRDYGALFDGLLPLLPAIYDAAVSGPPTVVVAGISPIKAGLPGDASGRSEFVQQLEGPNFLGYLSIRYRAMWRKPSSDRASAARYESLEDIFTDIFVDRYDPKGKSISYGPPVPGPLPGFVPPMPGPVSGFVPPMPGSVPGSMPGSVPGLVPGSAPRLMPGSAPGLVPGSIPGMLHPAGNSIPSQNPQQIQLQFTRLIRVGLLHNLPGEVKDVSEREHCKRFLLANLWYIQRNATLEGKSLDFHVDYCRESYEGSILKWLSTLESSLLDNKTLKRVASILPSSANFTDVLQAHLGINKADAQDREANTEWQKVLHLARSGENTDSPPMNEPRQMANPFSSFSKLPDFPSPNSEPGRPTDSPTTDPIVTRVRGMNLDSNEKTLLSCVVDPTTIRTSFADVCIKQEVIDTLRTAVLYPVLFPEAFKTGILAAESMGGVLLFGPPGTGKTMACRALAKESGARMLQLQASTIQSRYVGDTEKIISAAFKLARRLGPCVLFIDELEALFSKRNDESKTWHRTMVTEFTQEMDGLSTANANQQAGLIVVGASNRPQDIDSAVLRRLSRRILVDLPTLQQRKSIITQYLRGETCDETVNIGKLAARTPLFSGSDLRHLVHSAALAAFQDTAPTLWDVQHGAEGVLPPESSRTPLAPRVIEGKHFDRALKQVSASGASNRKELDELRRWAKESFQSSF